MTLTQSSVRIHKTGPIHTMGLVGLWIAIVAPVAGVVDSIISMLRLPLSDEFDSLPSVFAPLAATTLLVALALAILWFLLAFLGQRVRTLPLWPLFASISIALLNFLVLALLAGAILPTKLEQDSAASLFKLGVAGVASLAMIRGSFQLGLDVLDRLHKRRSPVLAMLALPYLGILALALVWVSRFRLESTFSKEGLPSIALVAILAFTATAFYYLAGHLRAARIAAFFPLLAILIAPMIAALISPPPSGVVAPREGSGDAAKAVFLITIDTLRADVLSCYGSDRVDTKNLDGLAQDSVLFTSAISASSWTLPSVASFMTGVSPLVHGATAWKERLPDRFKTLAEYFSEAGYQTVAIGQNPVLSRERNLNQGFDEYDWIATEVRHPGISLGNSLVTLIRGREARSTTEDITDSAIARLELAKDGPVFFWIHYFDPHLPYTPPAAYLSEADRANPRGREFSALESVRMGRFGAKKEDQEWVRNLYEAEVRFVDEEVGRLLTAIKQMGLYDDATIVLSSDHGEEFWDHGGFEHGHTMYRELLNVPLMIKRPGPVAAGRVDAPVGTEALAPTLLELCGLPYDAASMTSTSFLAYLDGKATPPAPTSVTSFGTLYFGTLEAVTGPEFKFIHAVDADSAKLFDRALDPMELNPLSPTAHSAAVDNARQILNQAHGLGGTAATKESDTVVLDANTEESLRSLGYIE